MSAEDKKSKAKIPRVVMPEQDAEARKQNFDEVAAGPG